MNKIDFLTAVNNSQRCQRNWDLSKEVGDETIAWLMEIGYSTATKQNLDTFEVVCIKDRSVIQEFTKAATNPDYNRDLLDTRLKEQKKTFVYNNFIRRLLYYFYFFRSDVKCFFININLI